MKSELAALLTMNPFSEETSINRDHTLTEDYFLSELYVSPDLQIDKNVLFERSFTETFLSTMQMKHQHVALWHFVGYAGSGKTTYLSSILYNLKAKCETLRLDFFHLREDRNEFICNEIGGKLDNIIRKCVENNTSYTAYLKTQIEQMNLESLYFINKNIDLAELLKGIIKYCLNDSMNESDKNIRSSPYQYIRNYTKYYSSKDTESELASILLAVLFFVLFTTSRLNNSNRTIVLFFDNLDTIEEYNKEVEFINTIYWLTLRFDEFYSKNSIQIGLKEKPINLQMIMVTRKSTALRHSRYIKDHRKGVSIYYKAEMPTVFFNHQEILENRIMKAKSTQNELHFSGKGDYDKFVKLVDFFDFGICYQFTRELVNMNYDHLVKRFLDIIYEDNLFDIFLKTKDLLKNTSEQQICYSRIIKHACVFSMYMQVFFMNDLFSPNIENVSKVVVESLSSSRTSLSRLILTYIIERGGYCSLHELNESMLLVDYTQQEIAICLYALSEAKRDIWRRLIAFVDFLPSSVNDILNAVENDKNVSIGIEICISGNIYIDSVITHFEFISCIGNYDRRKNSNYKTQLPLFLYADSHDNRWIAVIDAVIETIRNQNMLEIEFSKTVIKNFDISQNAFLSTSYNYMTKKQSYGNTIDNTEPYYSVRAGLKQSQTARLVFSSVGYIERFRKYMLNRNKIEDSRIVETNKLLTNRISGLLSIYSESPESLRNSRQDSVNERLMNSIRIIETNNFNDMETAIEIH